MKQIGLIFFILLISNIGFSQQAKKENNILKGLVKLQNSGSKPLDQVSVKAVFREGEKFSGEHGEFTIEFDELVAGMRVHLVAEKEGYEVINEEELENCIIRKDPNDLLVIRMTKKGDRLKERLKYYQLINENNGVNELKKEIGKIKNTLEESSISSIERDKLNLRIDELKKQNQILDQKAKEAAKLIADTDFDSASKMAQDAFEKFKSGNVNEAFEVLNDEVIEADIEKARAEIKRGKEITANGELGLKQSIENFLIKGRFYLSTNDYDQAEHYFIKAAMEDSTNVENLIEVAQFFGRINEPEKSIQILEKVLYEVDDVYYKSYILKYLSRQQVQSRDFNGARNSLEEIERINEEEYKEELTINDSLNFYNQLSKLQFNLSLAEVQAGLADLYLARREVGKSMEASTKAIKYYDEYLHFLKEQEMLGVTGDSISVNYLTSDIYYEKLNSTIWLAKGYNLKDRYDLAETTYSLANDILNALLEYDSDKYSPLAILTKLDYGWTLHLLRRYEEGILVLNEAMNTSEPLYLKSPKEYYFNHALIYQILGYCYRDLEDFEKGKEILKTCIEIFEPYAIKTPSSCLDRLLYTKEGLCQLYFQSNEIKKAKELIIDIEIGWESFYKLFPQESIQHFAFSLNNLGYELLSINDLEEGFKLIIRSKELKPDNSWVYRNLSCYYAAKGDKKEALKMLE
ncbi:MAG: hypothetical protein AB8H03_28035, partial [Saprospiraceae bacterium]